MNDTTEEAKNSETADSNRFLSPITSFNGLGNTQRRDSGITGMLEPVNDKGERYDSNGMSGSTGNAARNFLGDNSSNSSTGTVPSTIDVSMKDADGKNNTSGLSWRQPPSESFSDWTIEVFYEDITKPSGIGHEHYYVHRRVLAVGPKRSNYFANIFKCNAAGNWNRLELNKREAAAFPMILDFVYADVEFDMDTEKAYTVSYWNIFQTSVGESKRIDG